MKQSRPNYGLWFTISGWLFIAFSLVKIPSKGIPCNLWVWVMVFLDGDPVLPIVVGWFLICALPAAWLGWELQAPITVLCERLRTMFNKVDLRKTP